VLSFEGVQEEQGAHLPPRLLSFVLIRVPRVFRELQKPFSVELAGLLPALYFELYPCPLERSGDGYAVGFSFFLDFTYGNGPGGEPAS
jgi:hypothetical protein